MSLFIGTNDRGFDQESSKLAGPFNIVMFGYDFTDQRQLELFQGAMKSFWEIQAWNLICGAAAANHYHVPELLAPATAPIIASPRGCLLGFYLGSLLVLSFNFLVLPASAIKFTSRPP